MSEQIDYEERLPRQPSEGALDWCIRTKFKTEYAIYRDTYYRDPLTGIRENAVSVACTACGGSWIAEKVRGADCGKGWAPFGFVEGIMQIGPEDKLQCPQCGAELRAKHVGQMSRAGIDDNVYFCEPWQLAAAKAMAETASSDAEKKRLTGEIEDLRRKLAMSDKDVTAAQLYFYQWQAAFNQLTQAISHIKDEDKAGKLCAAIRAQLAAWGKAMEGTT